MRPVAPVTSTCGMARNGHGPRVPHLWRTPMRGFLGQTLSHGCHKLVHLWSKVVLRGSIGAFELTSAPAAPEPRTHTHLLHRAVASYLCVQARKLCCLSSLLA